MDNHEDFGPTTGLWDAGEGVCCAAFQLGACAHTEGGEGGEAEAAFVGYETADAEIDRQFIEAYWAARRAAEAADANEPF